MQLALQWSAHIPARMRACFFFIASDSSSALPASMICKGSTTHNGGDQNAVYQWRKLVHNRKREVTGLQKRNKVVASAINPTVFLAWAHPSTHRTAVTKGLQPPESHDPPTSKSPSFFRLRASMMDSFSLALRSLSLRFCRSLLELQASAEPEPNHEQRWRYWWSPGRRS